MPFFQGAYDFEINGGNFYDVKGDMNTYKTNNSVNVTGDNNQTTIAPNYSRNDNRAFHYGVNNYNGPTQNYTSGTEQHIHGAHSQTVTSDHNQQNQLAQVAQQFANMRVRDWEERSDPPTTAHSNPTSPHSPPPIRPSGTPQHQPGAQQPYPPSHPAYPPYPQYPIHPPHYYPPLHHPHQTGPIPPYAMALDGFNSPSPVFHQPDHMWQGPSGASSYFEERPTQSTQNLSHQPGHLYPQSSPSTSGSPLYAPTGSSAWSPNVQGHHGASPAPPSPPINASPAPSPPINPNPVPVATSVFPTAAPNGLPPSNHSLPVFPSGPPANPPLPMPAVVEHMPVPVPSVAPAVFGISPVSSPPPLTSTPSSGASSSLHGPQTPGNASAYPKKKKKWYFLGLKKSKKLKVEVGGSG